ncbi:MAG: hypothetical protein P4L92_05310 [Rudaea sp.]|nr:hypothetical protein [Rudaea sp.]
MSAAPFFAVKAEVDAAIRRPALALTWFARGDNTQGQAQLAEMIRLDAEFAPFYIVDVSALRGDADLAFTWLDHGYTTRDAGVTALWEDSIFVPALRQTNTVNNSDGSE